MSSTLLNDVLQGHMIEVWSDMTVQERNDVIMEQYELYDLLLPLNNVIR